MKRIAIICAFYDELIYFIEKYNIDPDKDVNFVQIGNYEVVIVSTGVGKVNAALAVQKVIDIYHPLYIINSGCSGALKEGIPLYGIILSESVMYHDFTPKDIMKKYVPNQGILKADPYLIKQTRYVLEHLGMRDYIQGKIVSGDCYISDEEVKQKLLLEGALCVDMESAAVGHVCMKNKIPFLCIRGISDFANGGEADEIESSRKAAIVTEELIRSI